MPPFNSRSWLVNQSVTLNSKPVSQSGSCWVSPLPEPGRHSLCQQVRQSVPQSVHQRISCPGSEWGKGGDLALWKGELWKETVSESGVNKAGPRPRTPQTTSGQREGMEGRTGELQGLTLSSEQTRHQYFLHVPSLRSIKMSRAERTTEEGWGESRTLNYDAIASVSKKWILMESWTSWTGPDHLCEATVNITCWKAKELITAGTSWLWVF